MADHKRDRPEFVRVYDLRAEPAPTPDSAPDSANDSAPGGVNDSAPGGVNEGGSVRWPRERLIGLGAVVVLLVGLLGWRVVDGRRADRGAAVRSRPPVGPTGPGSVPGGRYIATGGGPVRSLALGDDGLFVLEQGPSRLGLLVPGTRSVASRVTAPAGASLVAEDGPAHYTWAAASYDGLTEVRRVTVRRFRDQVSLGAAVDVRVDASISAIAALDGMLFLAGPTGLFVVTASSPTGRLVVDRAATGEFHDVVADRDRRRVLVTSAGERPGVWSISVGGAAPSDLSTTRRMPAPLRLADLPVDHATLAVTSTVVWVSGLTTRGPRTVRLDPDTGAVLTSSALTATASGTSVVRAGVDVVWLSLPGQGLRCLGVLAGELRETWATVDGTVTSRIGYAYAVAGGRLQWLNTSEDCPG